MKLVNQFLLNILLLLFAILNALELKIKNKLNKIQNTRIQEKIKSLVSEKENFLFLPTPLHKLKSISNLYKDYNIYIKRDDLTGLAFGGNKSRKLEYILHHAKKKNAKVLITFGSPQSNHARQTAAACQISNFECYLILVKNKNSNLKKLTGNFLLDHILGVNLIVAENPNEAHAKFKSLKEKLRTQSKNYYSVPIGGSDAAGLLGYINTYHEILQQEQKLNVKFDYIIHASASLATQVGLILGKKVFDEKNKDRKIIGVAVTKHYLDLQLEFLDKAKVLLGKFNKEFGSEFAFEENEFQIDERFMKEYEKMSANEEKAIKLFAEKEAIIVDPVYTGRAAGAMLSMLERNEIPKKANVLFIHTGGTPLIFSDIFRYKPKE